MYLLIVLQCIGCVLQRRSLRLSCLLFSSLFYQLVCCWHGYSFSKKNLTTLLPLYQNERNYFELFAYLLLHFTHVRFICNSKYPEKYITKKPPSRMASLHSPTLTPALILILASTSLLSEAR